MKRMKKIVSILLAAIMVLGMSMTVFADGEILDPNPETPENTEPKLYEIYQIFTGDYADGVLSNIKWGQNGTGTVNQKVEKTVLDELEAVKDATSDTAKLAVITKYVNLTTTPIATGNGTTYTNLPAGYYLVKNTDGVLAGTGEAYTLYAVEVAENNRLEFNPKGGVPTPDKNIVELVCTNTEQDHVHVDACYSRVKANEASIGDIVTYEITGTIPSRISEYKTYYYKFTDTLSKGLTYNGDIKVTVDGTDVTDYFYKAAVINEETAVTEIEVSILDIKALFATKILDCDSNEVGHVHDDDCYDEVDPIISTPLTENTKVVVTYTARLNEDAVIAGDGNPNDVKLTYSNDPNHSGDGSTNPPKNPPKPTTTHPTGESPESVVVTYTTELTITKTNEDGAFLPGVEFTLTGNSVNVVLVTEESFVVDSNGEYWKLATTPETYTKEAPKDDVIDDETGEVKEKNNHDDYDNITTKYKKVTNVVAKGNGETKTDVVGTVQADGTVTFKGLGAGDYTLAETHTLPGYNTIEPINFTIEFDTTSKQFSCKSNVIVLGKTTVEVDGVTQEKSTNTFAAGIENKKGSLLPSTGGIGTTIFYVVGGILVIGAGILLVAKKRMGKR